MNTIIEKIRAEVGRRIKSWQTRGEHSPEGQGKDTCVSRVTELTDLLSFLDTLQEQPVCEDVEHKNDIFEKAECWVSRNYPSAKGEEFDRLVTVYISGVAEGERRATEQMLKEAVEGEIVATAIGHLRIVAEANEKSGVKDADKVRIIIVKED